MLQTIQNIYHAIFLAFWGSFCTNKILYNLLVSTDSDLKHTRSPSLVLTVRTDVLYKGKTTPSSAKSRAIAGRRDPTKVLSDGI